MKTLKKIIILLLITVLCITFIPVSAAGKSYIEKADGSGYVTYRNSSEKVEVNSEYVYDTEFRAVWVTALTGNVGRFSNIAQYKAEITNVLDTMEYFNMNAMIFHIRIMNDAFYESKYNNWSIYYNTDPSWEALPWIIEECHKRGIEFHAWMNPYRVSKDMTSSLEDIASQFPSNNPASNPSNLLKGESSIILNPGIPEVKKFLVDTCMEVVENYDVDAIHFDDYFYDKNVDDSATRKIYNTTGLSLGDFRRKQVDDFIEDLSKNIDKYNRQNNDYVQLGISPSGIWQSGSGTVKYDANGNAITNGSNTGAGAFAHYDNYLYSDTLKWINEEWIDYILPQSYWAIEHPLCAYADLMKWWNDVVRHKDVSLYSGVGLYQAFQASETYSWKTSDLETYNQAMICNTLDMVEGISIYDYEFLEKAIRNDKAFKKMTDIWNAAAILPELKGVTPNKLDLITNFSAQKNGVGNLLTWDDIEEAKFYVIYRSEKTLTYDPSEAIDVIGHLTKDGKVQFTDTTAEEGKTYYYGVRAQSDTLTLNAPVSVRLNNNPTDELAHLGEISDFSVTNGIVPGSNITVRFSEISYPYGKRIDYKINYSFDGGVINTINENEFTMDNGQNIAKITVPYNATSIKIELVAENNIGRTVEIFEKEIVKGLGKIKGFSFVGSVYSGSNGTFMWQSLQQDNVKYLLQYSKDMINWNTIDQTQNNGESIIKFDIQLPAEVGKVYYRVYAECGNDKGYSDLYEMVLKNYLGVLQNYQVNKLSNQSVYFATYSDGLQITFDKIDVEGVSYALYVSYDLKEWVTARNYNSAYSVTVNDTTVIAKLPFTFNKLKMYFKVVASSGESQTESQVGVVYISIDGTFYADILPFLKQDCTGFVNEMDIFN